jgi:spermidine synthase
LTNGKFQGNNSGEMEAQKSFALMPLLHTSDRANALVIGYGTGVSAHILNEMGFKKLDIVELSADILQQADRYFYNINKNVSRDKNVTVYVTDGRNYLLTKNKKYNLISMEITSIWFSGAASLYSKDFYGLLNDRLTPNGVFQQWVQLHHMDKKDVVYIINTVRSKFKYVWLYYAGGQGIIVASNSNESLKAHSISMKHMHVDFNEQDLKGTMVLSPTGVDQLVKSTDPTLQHIVSTDDNLYLEYSTPKGNAIESDALSANLAFMRSIESQAK